MTDVYTKSKRSEIMSRVKNKCTSSEERVAAMLRELGVRFRRNDKTLPGRPDFSIGSAKIAVFVNGCFWHGHANCPRAKLPTSHVDFWTNKIKTNIRRDHTVARKLRGSGWRIVTVWQCRLRRPERVARRLRRILAQSDPMRSRGRFEG
ncbi:MAG: DNA mismatch endonuclease Vsr [Phycisphaerae bacterium]|nr:DNA mismatch endonuclease Vsr [Phycisphaerae bacterium]